MLTFTQTVNCAKKKLGLCTTILILLYFFFFFFCCEMHWDLNASHSPFVRSGGGDNKTAKWFICSVCFPRDQVTRKSRLLLSFMLETYLGFPWPLKWDILALCTWVVTIFSSRRMFEALLSCLWCSIQPSCCVSFGYPLGIFMFNQE